MSDSNSTASNMVSVPESDAASIEALRLEAENIKPHALSDFAGALSWQIPLSVEQKKAVQRATRLYLDSLDDLPRPGLGLLELLDVELSLSTETLQDPAGALEQLVAGARGQALGLAVQTLLDGFATDVSVNEYALAALQLSLDPLRVEDPQRNQVAGFDLADRQHWGKPVAQVADKLRTHLISDLTCSPKMAGLGAYALLACNAPLFLIKDIPADVKYGGLAWFNLAVAAATIEGQSPGKVAKMSFAQVMVFAEQAALTAPRVAQYAQTSTLIDWGVIHGVVDRKDDESYTEEDFRRLKTHFNDELADRLNTPILLKSELPSREKIARVALVKTLGEDFPIEKPVLNGDANWAAVSGTAIPTHTLYTVLDAAMMGGHYTWDTRDPLTKQHLHTINTMDLRVRETFEREFETALNNLKNAVRMSVRRLISELPLEDRENIEYGKVDFYQNMTITLSEGFWGSDTSKSNETLLLRVERGIDKKVSVYGINLKKGKISRLQSDPATYEDRKSVHVPSVSYGMRPFHLANKEIAANLKQRRFEFGIYPVPQSYSSDRSGIIADAFVEHIDIDNIDIRKAAEGQTTLDKELAVFDSRLQFLLNLIPFKSAISNFIEGKYIDGAIDLFLDVMGFVTAGVTVVAKLAKLATTTASALSRALKAAKIIGVLVLGELNPLSGLSVLATGAVRLLGNGAKFVANHGLRSITRLRGGVAGSYELLQAVGKLHGTAMPGIWKVGEHGIDGIGVLKNDQWYPYNLVTQRVYGAPGDFRPRQGRMGSLFGADANYADRYSNFTDNIEVACTRLNLPAFRKGYEDGLDILDSIPDYSFLMNTQELVELAGKPGRRPEEMGALAREIKDSLFDDAKFHTDRLLEDMPKGVKVVPSSQMYFLARVDMASNGRCAALAYAMAYAYLHRREDILLSNLLKAANKQTDPQAARFISALEKSQQRLGAKYSFHTGGKPEKMGAQNIIDDLADSREQKILMIGTKSHGMVAGTRFIEGKQEWFFYDPNSGMAIFASRETLQEGLSKALGDGALAKTFQTYGTKRGGADYAVNEFKPDGLEIKDVRGSLEGFSEPLNV
jgi:hypothetical protein